MKSLILCALSVSIVCSSHFAEAKRRHGQEPRSSRTFETQKGSQQAFVVDESASDSDIIRAINDQRRVNFVEGGSMTVVSVLPDDTNGREHQKWTVRLSNGKTMQAVYNLDMCPRVPLKKGDVIAMGGEFVWTQRGGLLHWLHKDPRGNRPAGYVYVNGNYYCKDLN
ncbi:DUF3465 domain-containing protein [Bdellovibrio bacteriovorus]|uniref:DUF3465 domain-containing protein n=1 Tax=Bdellovibrio bacteriovorus TaxID=959 RepID=UPI0035A67D9C